MAFREKSAWGMTALLLVAGALFLKLALIDGIPAAFAAFPFVLLMVAGSIVLQIAIALFSLKDANSPADERDKLIADKAGHIASYVLALAIVMGLGHYMMQHDGNALFLVVATGLIAAQLAEYAAQILLFRKWA